MDMTKFNSTATGFDAKNMACLAILADLAYKDRNAIGTVLNKHGFNIHQHKFFIECKKTDTQGFIVADESKIIVSFRGSEKELDDWKNNLKFVKKGFHPVGLVHKGFHESLHSVWSDVLGAVKTLQTNGQSIWFTGHSLGGALALLAAATMQLHDKKEVGGVYTFGQPRVGDKVFAEAYDQQLKEKTYLVVNNHDVVSRVPPRHMDYSHVSNLIYFDQDGQLKQDHDLSWWGSFWDRFKKKFPKWDDGSSGDVVDKFSKLPPEGIADHSRSEYIRLTEQAANKV